MSIKDTAHYYHTVLSKFPPKDTPPFEQEDMQARVWGQYWGARTDVDPLRLVLVHRPGEEVNVIDSELYDEEFEAIMNVEEQWYYRSEEAPDLQKMQQEHDGLVEVLRAEGVQVEYVEDCSPRNPHATFMRDTAGVVDGGAIIGRLGLVGEDPGTGRRGEEAFVSRKLAELGMPILLTVSGTGLFEGGSFCILDEETAVIGMSKRQNEEAARQIESVLAARDMELLRVPLTGHSLHLDGCVVMIDHDLALINISRLPYWFQDELVQRGIEPVNVHPLDSPMAINCLTLEPRKVIMCTGTDRTAEILAERSVEVIQVEYDEIHKNGGGIHCSTLPLIREPS